MQWYKQDKHIRLLKNCTVPLVRPKLDQQIAYIILRKIYGTKPIKRGLSVHIPAIRPQRYSLYAFEHTSRKVSRARRLQCTTTRKGRECLNSSLGGAQQRLRLGLCYCNHQLDRIDGCKGVEKLQVSRERCRRQ